MNTTTRATAPADGPLLEISDLSVHYGSGTAAVDGVSLRIGRGERVALVGESGSGKSTLALTIAGFVTGQDTRITSSRFLFDGRPIGRKPAHGSPMATRIPGISMVFQDAMTSLDPTWTIGSQLRSVLGAGGVRGRRALAAESAQWLERVGLHDARRVLRSRPGELSGGMRQRVMLALAVASRPTLLIADEPTSALDASLARSTMELFLELTEETGTALLLVTHDILLCREFSDRLLVMYRGELVDEFDPAAGLTEHAHPYTVGLMNSAPTFAHVDDETLPTLADFLPASASEESPV